VLPLLDVMELPRKGIGVKEGQRVVVGIVGSIRIAYKTKTLTK